MFIDVYVHVYTCKYIEYMCMYTCIYTYIYNSYVDECICTYKDSMSLYVCAYDEQDLMKRPESKQHTGIGISTLFPFPKGLCSCMPRGSNVVPFWL